MIESAARRPSPDSGGADPPWKWGMLPASSAPDLDVVVDEDGGAAGRRPASQRRARAVRVLVAGLVLLASSRSAGTGPSSTASTTLHLIASDRFHRTVAAGLGRADTGGAYQLERPASVAVRVADDRASFGPIAPGQSVTAALPSVSGSDVQMQTSFVVPQVPAGQLGVAVGVELRRQADGRGYRAAVLVAPDGRLVVMLSRLGVDGVETRLTSQVLATRVDAGQTVNLAGDVRGTTPVDLAVRAWVGSTAAPGWQLRYADDSRLVPARGTVGEWVHLSSRAAALTLQQSALRAWAPVPATPLTGTSAAQVVFAQNYDGLPVSDPVSVDTARLALGDPDLRLGSASLARTSIVAERGRGHILRVTLPADAIGEAGGAIIDARLPRALDGASIQYDIRFDPGFDWGLGGKLPGLGGAAPGVTPGTAGGCAGGNSGAWSGRDMWITPASYPGVSASNELIGYTYDFAKQASCGDNLDTGRSISAGVWHTIKMYYRMNTVTADGTARADGVLKMWLDGALIKDLENFRYRDNTGLHINYLYWEIFRGGDTMAWASPRTDTVDFDNLVIRAS
ncbi:MAG: polysaccharide lyase [Jatrophihabitans sp.]|uniref:polysaccharide lyase n=1 Tax=Jatrophihabitans sp. TaxID=1932789 RepID=UPI003F81FD3A